MGKKGKGYRREQEQEPVKKKNVITEQQLMDKSHMDRTEFIPLLNTQSLYEPFIFTDTSEVAVKKIVTDLNYLLYTDFKMFWATVLYNPTLKNCLASCLTYLHRRWMSNYRYSKEAQEDFIANQDHLINFKRVKDEAIYEYTQGLAQVVLIIYHRIVSFNKENKELSDLYKINEEISRKFILDFPKLFELAEIYGETNPEIVSYIVKMYSKTLTTFYQILTTSILPHVIKKMDENIRKMKNLSERQQYGVNYSYKRLQGRQLSQGQEQLMKKIGIFMELIGFIKIINTITRHFPEDCEEHCYFNSQIQFIYENVFLELEIAYKVWNYQGQQIKILNMVNCIMKECTNYFIRFFDRCNDIIVLRNRKSSTKEAYLNSLQRVFKDFGKRNSVSKKNQARNLIMYKIIQKEFNVLKMAQAMYEQEAEDGEGNFNLEYLKDFIIALESQIKKDEYINEDEPRQQQIQQETQAPFGQQHDSFEQQEKLPETVIKKSEVQQQAKPKSPEIEELQVLVPKRMRSEDYYSKLYANFSNKYYKGEYDDDYDDIADYDKRPLFFEEESSDESQEENERRLVGNANNLQHVKSLHNHRVDRDNVRNANVNKPKYERVNNNPTGGASRPQEKSEKTKYVLKQTVQTEQKQQRPYEYREEVPKQGQQQKRGGQGYKKSNKGHNFKPKDRQEPTDKHRNTNKNRDDRQGGNKKYRPK